MSANRRHWKNEIDTIHKEMERLLDHYAISKPPMIHFAKRAWEPAVDIYETAERIIIAVDLAGIDENELQLVADRNTLAIRGKRVNPGFGSRRSYYQMEITSGPFERIISLPVTVDATKAHATYNKGILEITAPKSKKKPTTKSYITIFRAGGDQ